MCFVLLCVFVVSVFECFVVVVLCVWSLVFVCVVCVGVCVLCFVVCCVLCWLLCVCGLGI